MVNENLIRKQSNGYRTLEFLSDVYTRVWNLLDPSTGSWLLEILFSSVGRVNYKTKTRAYFFSDLVYWKIELLRYWDKKFIEVKGS